jgi:hypothetical protein
VETAGGLRAASSLAWDLFRVVVMFAEVFEEAAIAARLDLVAAESLIAY